MRKILQQIGMYNILCRIFLRKKKFIIQPFFYIDNQGEIARDEMTDVVRWLDPYEVKTNCREFAEREFREYSKKQYKEHYKNIWIF